MRAWLLLLFIPIIWYSHAAISLVPSELTPRMAILTSTRGSGQASRCVLVAAAVQNLGLLLECHRADSACARAAGLPCLPATILRTPSGSRMSHVRQRF